MYFLRFQRRRLHKRRPETLMTSLISQAMKDLDAPADVDSPTAVAGEFTNILQKVALDALGPAKIKRSRLENVKSGAKKP